MDRSLTRTVASIALLAIARSAQSGSETQVIEQIEIAPLFYLPFACIEHPEGQLSDPGDALGSDCLVVGGLRGPSPGLMRFYEGTGVHNEDWFGWHAEVHAPFDGIVKDIAINPVTNDPGKQGHPPASYISVQRSDSTVVIYAHIASASARVGERVMAGQVIALVGNNGTAKAPHIHVGAFLGKTPLQIRWNLRAEGAISTLRGQ